jgi:hypothetical protein
MFSGMVCQAPLRQSAGWQVIGTLLLKQNQPSGVFTATHEESVADGNDKLQSMRNCTPVTACCSVGTYRSDEPLITATHAVKNIVMSAVRCQLLRMAACTQYNLS